MEHDTFTFTDTKCLLRNTPIQQYKNFPLLEQPVNHYYIIIIRCLCCVHSYCVVFLDVGEPFAPFKIPEPKKKTANMRRVITYTISQCRIIIEAREALPQGPRLRGAPQAPPAVKFIIIKSHLVAGPHKSMIRHCYIRNDEQNSTKSSLPGRTFREFISSDTK